MNWLELGARAPDTEQQYPRHANDCAALPGVRELFPAISLPDLFRLGRLMPDQEGDAGFLPAVHGDIDRVLPGFIKFQLLDIDHEVPHQKIELIGHHDIDGHIDAWHDKLAVFIDEIHFYLVRALFNFAKSETQSDRTLRVDRRQLACDDRIKGAEDVELSTVIGGRIAKNRNLYIHSDQAVVPILLLRSCPSARPGSISVRVLYENY